MTRVSPLSQEKLTAFSPDPERGSILYERVKNRLAESLCQIAEVSSSVVSVDKKRVSAFLDHVARATKISPSLFAIYHEILVAVDEDDVDRVSLLFAELVNQDFPSGAMRFCNLNDEHLGPNNGKRYRRWADMDTENPLTLIPLTCDEYPRIAATTLDAFSLMDVGAPEVSGEIRSLLTEVVFSNGGVGDKLLFHGISSFFLWGTVFLNAKGHKKILEVVQTLAHESSHMHLFAAALDGPLVHNADDDCYSSPLRLDPRPMDGIYHATYVTARMHYVLSRLYSSGALQPNCIEEADEALARHVKAFREGYEVVSTRGKLTELGQSLLCGSRAYMLPFL